MDELFTISYLGNGDNETQSLPAEAIVYAFKHVRAESPMRLFLTMVRKGEAAKKALESLPREVLYECLKKYDIQRGS